MFATLTGALVAALLWAAAPALAGGAYLPQRGQIFHGLTDSGQFSDTLRFRKQTRSHPAVSNYYVTWGNSIQEALHHWDKGRSRGLLTVTASRGHGKRGLINPRQISRGRGDAWLLQIGKTLRKWRDPVYVSLFPEMNGHWNSYAPYNKNGSRRPGNSVKSFKAAWRRTALILGGGSRRKINRKLRRLHMPKINRRHSIYKRLPRRLPRPRAAMLWIPQSHGSPHIVGNGPGSFWPGSRYVDWVGADTFSRFSNFGGLNSIYRGFARHYRKPMLIGEYAPWGFDDVGWVQELHRWARDRNLVRMLVYYQGFGEVDNPFQLESYPSVKRFLRRQLNRHYFQPYANGVHTRKK